MNSFEEIKTLLKESGEKKLATREIKSLLQTKSGKKLAVIYAFIFLLVTALVFFVVFRFFGTISLKQMDEYLGEIPRSIESAEEEMDRRNDIYEEDVLARAQIGLIVYGEENGLTEAERLERARSTVSADSVSLVDGEGKLLSTTGPVSPEEYFNACVQALEPRRPHVEPYRVLTDDGEETGKNQGKGFVLLPLEGNAKRSLVFEFPCEMVLEMYDNIDDLADVFDRMLIGGEASAYVETGDKLSCYTADDLTDVQSGQLREELGEVFRDGDNFWKLTNGRRVKFINLLGRRYFATLTRISEKDMNILGTFPIENVIGNGLYIAVAISVIIGWGMILLIIYIQRRLRMKKEEEEKPETVNRRRVCRVTWQGALVFIAVTFLFAGMMLQLEQRTNATATAMRERESVQHAIDMRKSEEDTIRKTYIECYRGRAQMLADFIRERPDYQTRAGLAKLSAIAGTDYLMRFDSAGQELVSSNSYTGFSVDTNLAAEYRAVLLGYPYVVVGPAADSYTGKMQLSTAILMTNEEGQPDGFLLAAYSAGDLSAELKRMGYENAVNSCTVQQGHIAAAVRNEDGVFIAHTDSRMIGQKAENFLNGFEPGINYEGFGQYDGKDVCISASSADGKTLIFIVPQRANSYAEGISIPLILAAVLILLLLYYPNAGLLVARAIGETGGDLRSDESAGRPMAIFSSGYSVFLTLFAIFALIASVNGWWISFDYVFSGKWSRGLHLFSIWAALMVLAVTICFENLIRAVLRSLESRYSIRARTVSRLASSLITYAASLFLIFSIFNMFGANTTALLASAGVVSIAVGMGAQSMASDLLAGFFMMLEGTIHVGDDVAVGSPRERITGKVVDMGIRTLKIVDETGNLVTLNNSKANPICNMNRDREESESEDGPESNPESKPENGPENKPENKPESKPENPPRENP